MKTEKQASPSQQERIRRPANRIAEPLLHDYEGASLDFFSGLLSNRTSGVRASAFSAIARRLNGTSSESAKEAALSALENAVAKGADIGPLLPLIESLMSGCGADTKKAAASLLWNYALNKYGVDVSSNWQELTGALDCSQPEPSLKKAEQLPMLAEKTNCELAPLSSEPFSGLDFAARVLDCKPKVIPLNYEGSSGVIIPVYVPVLQIGFSDIGSKTENTVALYAHKECLPAVLLSLTSEIAPPGYSRMPELSPAILSGMLEKIRMERKTIILPCARNPGVIILPSDAQPLQLVHEVSGQNIVPFAQTQRLPVSQEQLRKLELKVERALSRTALPEVIYLPYAPHLRIIHQGDNAEARIYHAETGKLPAWLAKRFAKGVKKFVKTSTYAAGIILVEGMLLSATTAPTKPPGMQVPRPRAEVVFQRDASVHEIQSSKPAGFGKVFGSELAPWHREPKTFGETLFETSNAGNTKIETNLSAPEEQYPKEFARYAEHYSKIHNVDLGLVKAVITAESNWDHSKPSEKGAVGLMQLMPATAAEMKVNPNDPEENVKGGVKYLGRMLKRFDGDVELALVAYNWGPENAEKYANGKIELCRETADYLKKIGRSYSF